MSYLISDVEEYEVSLRYAVSREANRKARVIARKTMGGLDAVGGQLSAKLGANTKFATAASLLHICRTKLDVNPAETTVYDIGHCGGHFCMYAQTLGYAAVGIGGCVYSSILYNVSCMN